MTIEELRSHIGCLIRIKTELYWYGGGRSWDGVPERLCILLDVADRRYVRPNWVATDGWGRLANRCLYLLIDEQPQWIALKKESFELVK